MNGWRWPLAAAGSIAAASLISLGCSDDEEASRSNDAGTGGSTSEAGAASSGGGSAGTATGGKTGTGGAKQADAAPEERAVTLRFKGKVGARDFACGETYSDVGSPGATVTPLDLRFYVQEVWLTSGSERTRVALDERSPWQTRDVALLDFEDGEGQCGNGNSQTNGEITGKVPAGKYDGIVFVVGVPDALNHIPDDQFPPPLQPIYMLWSWLAGFKFFVAEVAQLPSATSQASGDAGIFDAGLPGAGLLHVGSTGCYAGDGGEKYCAHPNRVTVTLSGFDLDASVVTVDVARVFGSVDLRLEQSCHSSGPSCPALFAPMGLDFATGEESSVQTVFGLE